MIVSDRFLPVKTTYLIIILIFLSACATREEFNRSFVERYVRDGLYTNDLKGFSFEWPEDKFWKFQNYPEFDLSFDHIDGRSQFVIVGVNGLIRRGFPGGFEEWLMDRLGARDVTRISQEDISAAGVVKYRIVADCEFRLKFGESFGVQRKVDMLLMKKDNHWVAMICICPRENYDDRIKQFGQLQTRLEMI